MVAYKPSTAISVTSVQTGRAGRGRARAPRHGRGGAARQVPHQRGRARHRHRRRRAAPLDLPPEAAAARPVAQIPEGEVSITLLALRYLRTHLAGVCKCYVFD